MKATVPNSTDGKVGAIHDAESEIDGQDDDDSAETCSRTPRCCRKYLAYACISEEFRASIEQAVLTGAVDASGGSAGPVGITQSASTVTVSTAFLRRPDRSVHWTRE